MLKVYACKKDLWVEPTGRDGEISFTPYAEAEARVRELEAKKDAAFWQGWSLLAGFIAGFHDEPSLVEEAAREHGVTLGLLEASGCDEFELEPLRRRVFMSAALVDTEVKP